jgi:glycosyltransferase involved in cell wall biosynthesis
MQKTLDIILPCYNPPKGWMKEVAEILQIIKVKYTNIELGLIIVNDGSTLMFSSEEQALVKQKFSFAKIINMPSNGGKGKALRTGVNASQSDFCLYTDIDIPFRTQSITNMLNVLFAGPQVVIGNRLRSYDNQLRSFRKVLSQGSHLFNKIILRIPMNDTQGGLKAFDKIGKAIFLETCIDRYLFDTEFVLLAYKRKNCQIKVVDIETKQGIVFSKMGFSILIKEAKGIFRLILISMQKNKPS